MSNGNPGTCIIVGVGPGLGASLARRFASAGHKVAVAARNVDKLASIVGDITGAGGTAKAYACDTTSEADVAALFEAAEADLGAMDVSIYNASGRARGPIADTTLAEFTDAWERCCLGGFLVGREAARRLGPCLARLLAAGADPTLDDANGDTPLDLAQRRGLQDVVELLNQHIDASNAPDVSA